MAPRHSKPNTQKVGRQHSQLKEQGRRHNCIKECDTELEQPRRSTISKTLGNAARDRKRKRSQENETSTPTPSRKRPQISSITGGDSGKEINPVKYWTEKLCWPEEYLKSESNMNSLLARPKSCSSLRGKQPERGSATPSSSDRELGGGKSISYTRPSYETILAAKGSFMGKSDLGITDASKILCETLLDAEQSVPQNTRFDDGPFDIVCERVRARNEAMVVRDIHPYICPSAQILEIDGAKHLQHLNESVSEGWNSAIPFCGPRPQPDYSVGFARSAFTTNQLKQLIPFVGEMTDSSYSYFMATWQMYFPFLTCEVKCGAAALDVADRQNAHSMTLAVRGVVKLFKYVKREKELHREILAFSISHDHSSVRIYGHYPLIDENKTSFYRHPIHKFDITARNGLERWTAYKFTKNVYDLWMPEHLKKIHSAINDLPPDLDFEVLQQSELGESGLSQGSEGHHLSNYDTISMLEGEVDGQPSRSTSRDITPDTSRSQRIDGSAFGNLKKRTRLSELDQFRGAV